MSDRQDQRIAAGAVGVQSARDTNINNGVGPEEIKAIVEGLADQLPRMAAVASAIVEERLKTFKEEVIQRFEHDQTTRRQSFEDPDFIEVLSDAQKAYARTDKKDSHGTLIDLIAERSKFANGERISFVLNEAVSVAPKLTSSELAELALSFAIKYVRTPNVNNHDRFGVYYQNLFADLVSNIEIDQSSYEYIVAQRCGVISMGEISLIECWRRTFTGLFMKGVDPEVYRALVGDLVSDQSVFIKSLFSGHGLQLNAMERSDFDGLAIMKGLSPESTTRVWDIAHSNLCSDEEFIDFMRGRIPLLPEVNRKWNESPLKNLELNALGKAIGHTRMSQVTTAIKADLSIWVR